MASLMGELNDTYIHDTTADTLVSASQELLATCIAIGVTDEELLAVPLPPSMEGLRQRWELAA